MKITPDISVQQDIPKFDRNFWDSNERLSYIGTGSLGGKAQSLAFINDILNSELNASDFPQIEVCIPTMVVLRTDVFNAFMKKNQLNKIIFANLPDERIAHEFQKADLPFEILGDLQMLISQVHSPLAVRSSSMLEDTMFEPFAGIYETKMTPNNQYDPNKRFQKLVEAIKFVYASTYFKSARDYMKATEHSIEDEKMAVIIQEIVGQRHDERFYPELSGVARSYNFYPMGRVKPEEGVVNLALGLGKTIVDGGISWTYSPAYPKINPPYSSVGELLKKTQINFWTVNMGKPPAYDPITETEYMLEEDLTKAEKDETLQNVASTYNASSDRMSIGIGPKGPRVLTFAPILILNKIPLNDLIKNLLKLCEESVGAPVEIEFAMTFNPYRFGFLQVRPMVVSTDKIEIKKEELTGENVLIATENVLGNGINNNLIDVVYVKPESFEVKFTQRIANDLENINQKLITNGCHYLLIGFGRWGSSDPWLGIPVNWGQVSGVKVIVEATLGNMNVDLSQGSHFFHNLTSFKVSYFSVPFSGKYQIDWEWLDKQEIIEETQFVRHVRLSSPLQIKVDGRSGCGVINKF
ncbi:PEP/pyruvate-binding domain-containing protein [Bacteroidota bacterium]